MKYSAEPDFPLTLRDRLALAGFLAVALWVVAACGGCRADYVPERPETMSPPAVARMMTEGVFTCTAWKVREGLAMTAGHCCDLGKTYTFETGAAVPGAEVTVLVDDDAHDVCVLRAEMRGMPIALAPHDPPIGSVVWTAGYPINVFLVSEGLWSGRQRIGSDEYESGICSAAGGFGGSGSPIMDWRGRAIGVFSRRYQVMDNLMIVTPVEWMRTALARAMALQ